ncbi:AsmA family protein [Flavobacterium foetidum]|uniref:AsmA family protein n=1 Tax=Flavobacterium foetidum TaxID=2026681 RepID=UPI001074BF1A|nr:AsmA family protein [Flavobacterium foetidum]KAF2510546.1 AsmA family protein [Flavobacterium foetidum]
MLKYKPQLMIKKFLKRTAIFIASIVLLLVLVLTIIPYFFKDEITDKIESLANENLNAEVRFDEIGLSVFKHFPALIVYAKNVDIVNKKVQFASAHVVKAETAAVGINFYSLLKGKIVLDAVYLDDADLNLEIDPKGHANFNIVKPSKPSADTTQTEFKIKKVVINKTNIFYNDKSTLLKFKIHELNYKGTGDLSAAIFDLNSNVKIKSFDFSVAGVDYVRSKPINAEIVTYVDTKALKFKFERNAIRIKNFPFSFNGHFAFIKGGYDFDLRMHSKNSTLEEMLSLVPPAYDDWREQMTITGNINFGIFARGKYMQDQSEKPVVSADLQINNGTIAYKKITEPVKDINISAKALVRDLDLNKLKFDLDNLSFNLGQKKTTANFHSEGFKKIKIKTAIKADLDAAKFKEALNLNKNYIRGDIALDLKADGIFLRDLGFSPRLNKVDTIIKSIPKFQLNLSLKNGYLKNTKTPDAIKNVNLNLSLMAKDSILRNVSGKITNLNAEALGNFVHGQFELHKLYPFTVDTELESKINLATVHQFYPLDSLELKGDLNLKVSMHGVLNRKQKKYPSSKTIVKIKNGNVKSLKFPNIPIENINVSAAITSVKGTGEDLTVKLQPAEFVLAGSPFKVQGEVTNLYDLVYNIKTQGTLDVGKLTKLFPIKDVAVSGIIQTNLIAKGSKKDLDAKNYDNIKNGGKLEAKNIVIKTAMFPETFQISRGTFKFFKDKMRFEDFNAAYGKSDIVLNGYIHNVLRYVFNRKYLHQTNEKLKADIELSSNHIDAGEFFDMIAKYTDQKAEEEASQKSDSTVVNTAVKDEKPKNKNYVIRIPKTADLKITAKVHDLRFDTYKITDFVGNLIVNDRKVQITEAGFNMAGTKIEMTGDYKAQNRLLAKYNANFKASNFDIQRAYAEIPIFAELVSMAKDAYGVVSVDYKLGGSIDQNMNIDFKSIDGEGTLTLEDIKFKNFKLLNHVAKKADAADLEKASFNKIAIHSTIKNNVMTITPTTMKMASFRGKLEGQVTMDGKINVGFRLGLPPMGLINIPMKITGTADDFKISTGKFKEDTTFAEESDLNNVQASERRRFRRKDTLNLPVDQRKVDTIQKR